MGILAVMQKVVDVVKVVTSVMFHEKENEKIYSVLETFEGMVVCKAT